MHKIEAIMWEMRRVPKIHKAPRFVPMDKLPEGTLLDVTGMEGSYSIILGIWPTILLVNYPLWGRTTVPVKPLGPNLAPTSSLVANFSYKNDNRVLTTEEIRCILVVDTPYVLQSKDLADAEHKRKLDIQQLVERRYSRGFKPLIDRRNRPRDRR